MSGSRDRTALPPEASRYGTGRRSTSRSSREWERRCFYPGRSSSSTSPTRQGSQHQSRRRRHVPTNVNKPSWPHAHARPKASSTQDTVPEPSWHMVLGELAVLKGEVARLNANTQHVSQPEVNVQASTSGVTQHTASPATFSGFVDSSSEDGEIRAGTPRGSVLLQCQGFGAC